MADPSNFVRRLAEAWPLRVWRHERVVVAVSGGPDSVALLRGLLDARPAPRGDCIVAHFNHGLRGSESEDDERFVRDLAARLGVACDVGRTARGDPPPPTASAATRELRYRFLRETAADRAARYVAVAHTADDQAETILQRILRGTGIAGLRGIPPRRRLGEATTLVRPALGVRRAEVLAYLRSIGQSFREDSSNRALRKSRNRIRYELLPLLEREYNPRVVESLLRLGEQAAEAHSQLEAEAAEATEHCALRREGGWDIDCPRLAAYPPAVVQAGLARLWRAAEWPERAMGRDEWKSLLAIVTGGPHAPSRRDFPGAIDARRAGPMLHLRARLDIGRESAP